MRTGAGAATGAGVVGAGAAARLVECELLLCVDELRLQVLLMHGILVPGGQNAAEQES